ncbi:MAG TPA: amino acid ABC transporter substrate-binding protein [Casimicrobiaceae bacterium]|jgi:glutamate/aspartate transport system substrate-binding protein
MNARRGRGLVAIALLALASVAWAEAPEVLPAPAPAADAPLELAGTLAKARASGHIAIGYRQASVPFSYVVAGGAPIGYSIEICRALVDAIGTAVNRPLTIQWVPVTPETRVDAVVDGRVDLECGSTTNNLERRRRVAFSPTIFVSGTKLMVKKSSPIRSFRDLAGRKVVVTRGTTNEKAMRDLKQRFGIAFDIAVMPDHGESFAEVASGRADAFATDDVLLYGLIAERGQRAAFEVIGEFLSYDPYGIMFRRDDPALAKVVNDTLRSMAANGDIGRQYERWFLRKLPSGASLDLPMSAQLETILETMAAKAE